MDTTEDRSQTDIQPPAAEVQTTPPETQVTAAEHSASGEHATSAETTNTTGAPVGTGTGSDVDEVTMEQIESADPVEYARLMQSVGEGTLKIKDDPAAAAAAPPASEPGQSPEGEPPEPTSPPAGKRPEMKLQLPEDPAMADLYAETLRIQRESVKRGNPLTPSAAEQLARQVLGMTEPAAPAAAGTETPAGTTEAPAPQAVETLESVEAEIVRLREVKAQKFNEFEFDALPELEQQIDDLVSKRAELRVQQVNQTAEAQRIQQAWTESRNRAVEAFGADQVGNAESNLNLIAAAVEDRWRQANDPRAFGTDAPFLIYQEAAAKLGLASKPGTAQTPVRPSQPSTSKPVHRPVAASILAGGNAGAMAPGQVASGSDELDAIDDPVAYEQFVGKAAGSKYAAPQSLVG